MDERGKHGTSFLVRRKNTFGHETGDFGDFATLKASAMLNNENGCEKKGSNINNAPEYEDDEEDMDVPVKNSPHNIFFYWIKTFLCCLFPNWTPLLMCGANFLIATCLCFLRASEGGSFLLLFLTLYVCISTAIWLLFLLTRVVVETILRSYASVEYSRIYNVAASILNPEGVYLACTIFLSMFWSRAITVVDMQQPLQRSDTVPSVEADRVLYRFLGIDRLTALALPRDRDFLRRTEYFLIIWASRDVVMNIAVFFFLVSFMKNVNRNLVDFLTLYSLIRKLNANWISLSPIFDELTAIPGVPLDRTQVTEDGNVQTPFIDSSLYGDGAQHETDDQKSKCDEHVDELSKEKYLNSTELPVPSGVSHVDDKNTSNQFSKLASHIVDELLLVEAQTKERKQPRRSFNNLSCTNVPLYRLQSTVDIGNKRRASIWTDIGPLDSGGTVFPPELLQENIEKTEKSGLSNFLAVNYVHNHPVALFVRGVRVELYSKYLARLVGRRLFEELIEFRNSIVPEGDQTAEELDQYVSKCLFETIERRQRILTQSSNVSDISYKGADGHSEIEDTDNEKNRSKSASHDISITVAPHIPENKNLSLHADVRTTPSKHYLNNLSASRDVKFFNDTYSQGVRHSLSEAVSNPNLYGISISSEQNKENGHQERVENSNLTDSKRLNAFNGVSDLSRKYSVNLSQEKKNPPASHIVGPAISVRRLKKTTTTHGPFVNESRFFLTSEFFSIFLGNQVHDFMKYADPGGRDRVTAAQFTRMIMDTYQMQKQLVSLVDSQKGIQNVFQRMVAILLGFVCILIFLVIAGVSATTIVISGAASISSITVALNCLYSDFIKSVMFVCFLNPYNVGDRVRLEGELLIVKKVSTFFSEFLSIPYNKPSFWNHSLLYSSIIVNESRCRNAGLEIPIRLAFDTNPSIYDTLHKYVENYINSDPEFVKGSLFLQLNEAVLGHYVQYTYWVNCTESWHHWKAVYSTRTRLLLAIAHKCTVLGIAYRLPVQPVWLTPDQKQGNPITMVSANPVTPSVAPKKQPTPVYRRYV